MHAEVCQICQLRLLGGLHVTGIPDGPRHRRSSVALVVVRRAGIPKLSKINVNQF